MDQRFRWLERPATGGLVVIEIDSRKPYERWIPGLGRAAIIARAIDALFAAGAKEIGASISI